MLSRMNIPKLRKEKTTKTYHGYELTDDYAYVDQSDILTVLKKPENLILFEILAQNTILENDYGYGQFRVFYVDLCPFISKCNRFLLICCRILFIFCCFSFIF